MIVRRIWQAVRVLAHVLLLTYHIRSRRGQHGVVSLGGTLMATLLVMEDFTTAFIVHPTVQTPQ